MTVSLFPLGPLDFSYISRTGRVRQPDVSPAFVSNFSIVIIAGRRQWFFPVRVFHVKFVSPLCIYFYNNICNTIETYVFCLGLHTKPRSHSNSYNRLLAKTKENPMDRNPSCDTIV